MKSMTGSCEQLIHTWALQTLEGSGSGVVAASPGWPTARSSLDPEVAEMVDFLPQGSSLAIQRGTRPPVSVEYLVDARGLPTLTVKRYLGVDAAGRPGRVIVHALLDTSGRLTAGDGLRVARSGALAGDWPLDAAPDAALPVLDADRLAVRGGPMNAIGGRRSAAFVAVVLDALRTGSPVVIRGEADPLGLLETALAVLPKSMTAHLTYSTYRADPRRSRALLTFESLEFGLPWTPDGRVISLDEVVPTAQATRVADALLAGAVAPDEAYSVERIDEYLRLDDAVRGEPARASVEQLILVLSSPRGGEWLRVPDETASVVDRLARSDTAGLQRVASAARGSAAGTLIAGSAMDQGLRQLEHDPTRAVASLRVAAAFSSQPRDLNSRIVERLRALLDASSLGSAHRDAFPEQFAEAVSWARTSSSTERTPPGLVNREGYVPPSSWAERPKETTSSPLHPAAEPPPRTRRNGRTTGLHIAALALVVASGATLGLVGPSIATWTGLIVATMTAVLTTLLVSRHR